MSMFLPEGTQGAQPSGVANLTPPNPNVTTEDVALMQRVLNAASQNPNLIPDAFMAYVLDYIQANNLQIPIGQVFGFTQFTAQIASDNGSGTTSATAYGDLSGASVGPTLSGLPDGNYVLLYGAGISSSSTGAQSALVAPSVNGATAQDSDAAQSQNNAVSSCSRAITSRLAAGGSNSVSLKYRSTGGTATFSFRWLIALRFANL